MNLKNTVMKKILLAVTAALAITGCSQNEEFDNAGQKAEIKMGTSAVTRATPMVTAKFGEFRAFGYAYTEDAYSSSVRGTNILEGSFKSTDQTNWTEADSKTFYWPSEGKVAFFGYSPSVLPDSKEYIYPSGGGYPTVAYKVNSNISDQADFLVAQLADQVKSANAVSLTFKHALTQVVFKLKGDDKNVEYTVTNITFKDLKDSGTYSYQAKDWTLEDASVASYSIVLADNNSFMGGDATAKTLEATDQLMILMPQKLTDAIVEVTFSAKKDNVEIFKSGVKTAKISETWSSGEKYIYTLVLKAGDELKVSGTVEDEWTSKDNTANVDTNKVS